MELKDQVCSLVLSQQLDKLGVKQDSAFSWIEVEGQKAVLVYKTQIGWYLQNGAGIGPHTTEHSKIYAAYTVAELGEMLAKNKHGIMPDFNSNFDGGWYYRGVGWTVHEDTEADARTKILIYLLENQLITL